MRRSIVAGIIASFAAGGALAKAPETRLLWPNGAPGAHGKEEKDKPKVFIYLPDPAKAVGTGVVVCPGGGYGFLAMDHEGTQIADWLTQRGIAAFVLQYRIAPRYHHPAPMLDVQRAMRLVRASAAEFGVKPNRIGVWGFSAGGHLAGTATTHFDAGAAEAADPIDRVSSRPDFSILAYGVLSMELPTTHRGSRENLLGKNPDPKLVEYLSNEKQVTKETPPVFLFHTGEDKGVPVENSLLFYAACVKAGVPAELHVHERGRHGVGLAQKDGPLSAWPENLERWIHMHGFLSK